MFEQRGVGMVALVCDKPELLRGLRSRLAEITDSRPVLVRGVWVASWGMAPMSVERPMVLSGTRRAPTGAVTDEVIARWLATGQVEALRSMLPPFAALGAADDDGLRLSTDSLGFRPIFRSGGEDWSAVSTSAWVLSQLVGQGLDETGLLLQSQLGWQLGKQTLYRGVVAVLPGESLLLRQGEIHSEGWSGTSEGAVSQDLSASADEAAAILREMLSRYLDETDDPTIQLTGGQDSRIVLSAVPKSRRSGLKAMTLHVPGTRDAELAGQLSEREGLHHTVRSLEGAELLSGEQWWRRTMAAARLHDSMVDPIARAVTAWAEESFEQGPRLSGLGGELARGFYYLGPARPLPVTYRRAANLARWRMLVNDAVEPEAMAVEQRKDAAVEAVRLIHQVLLQGGSEWFAATDWLYLQRMRRWAGPSESAISFRRSLTNPMLDPRFIAVSQRLAPRKKQNAQFLGRLQVGLDSALARIPLDDRPAPRVYAQPGLRSFLHIGSGRVRKGMRKVVQRVTGARRPALGGVVVTGKLAEHLRRHPELLDPVQELGFFDQRWLADVSRGDVRPSPGSMALLVNVLAAVQPDRA